MEKVKFISIQLNIPMYVYQIYKNTCKNILNIRYARFVPDIHLITNSAKNDTGNKMVDYYRTAKLKS